MHLFLLITGIVLFPKVYTLKCYHCGITTDKCSDTESECPSNTGHCWASRLTQYAGNTKLLDAKQKGCAPASQCVEGSLNIGKQRTIMTGKCCTTDLCNNQLPPQPAAPRPNGKKCIGCDGIGDCGISVDCVDNEDHCFTNTVNSGILNMTLKGCVSKSFCLNGIINLQQISSQMTCCQGNNCNGAGSTGGSLLLQVVTVVSLAIVS